MRRFMILMAMLLLVFLSGIAALAQSGGFYHIVRPGETLFRISLRYNVPVAAILSANPSIRNINVIYAGTSLLIPSRGATPTPIPPTPAPTIHIVARGENLFSIARRYNTSIDAIVRANSIVNPNRIAVGQRLVIPVGGSVPPPSTPIPPTATPRPTPPPLNVPFELGGHVFGFQNAAQMRDAGMTWARVKLEWSQGQPPSIARQVIDEARLNGLKILLSVSGDPAQMRQNPAQYIQSFASFLRGVAGFAPDAIQVWNEPNIDREWPSGLIDPRTYTQMLSAAYQAIKGVNQNIMVVSGAPAPTGFFAGGCSGAGCDDEPFIRSMAANGAANFLDCVGIHYNEGVLGPDARSGDPRGNPNHYTRYYGTMVDLYVSVFPTKPLCFTELGYLSPEGFGSLPQSFNWASNTSVQDQAEWLARAAVLAGQSGRVRLMIVWNMNATSYGTDPQAGYAIIRPNGTCLACNTLSAVTVSTSVGP